MIGCVAGLSLLDPPSNWVTFTVYDSQFLHFPTTWNSGSVSSPASSGTELFMIRAHMYHYSEAWGPTIGVGHGRYPIIWGFFTWWAIATVTAMLYRDDRGRSLAHTLAEKLPGSRSLSSPRVVLAGTLFLMALYLVPMGLYGAIRVTGLSHANPSGWHYPEAKVYDPYGRLADAGIPGPYYK